MKFRYTSKYCIMGMMSQRYEPFDNWLGFRKNRNNAVSFDPNFAPDFPKVHYQYIYERPKRKGIAKSTQIVSRFDDDFFALKGKKWREIRETRNKWDKTVTIKSYNKDDVMGLIDKWDKTSGTKYGWHRHSGYDRAFFNRWFDEERDNLLGRFYYIGEDIVGYSVLHRGQDGWEYLIRKADNSIRNICLYVDYKTFEHIHTFESFFCVNWGASKGNLLAYKRKFPVLEETPVYSYSIKS